MPSQIGNSLGNFAPVDNTPIKPEIELTQIKAAATPATTFGLAHRLNSKIGLRKTPPPNAVAGYISSYASFENNTLISPHGNISVVRAIITLANNTSLKCWYSPMKNKALNYCEGKSKSVSANKTPQPSKNCLMIGIKPEPKSSLLNA